AALVALLLGGAVYGLAGPRRTTVRKRVAYFVPDPERLDDLLPSATEPSTQVLRAAEARLARSRLWARFKEDMDVGEIGIPPIRLVLYSVVAMLAGATIAAAAFGNGPLAVMFVLVPAGTFFWVRFKADRQRRAFDDQLADNLQVIASAMRAGQSFVGAMATAAADAAQPSRREFQRVVADEQLGIQLSVAMRSVAARMRSTEFEYVGLVAMLQRDTGGNTAEVIDRVTETIRERAGLRRLVRTLTAQGRFSGAVVSLLPVGIGGVISVLRPHYLSPMFHETRGVVALVLAALGIVMGWIIIRKIVDIKV
ncbi:MAG TPA: type II secretion system F family protein, partial [Solirubrobacteraceae bacterium]|nr:type II secretion system F family protein [Solirubrobacteraceae bacterium]